MTKNILKYSPFLGLIANIIYLVYFLYFQETVGSDAMGKAIGSGYDVIGFILIFTLYSLIIIFSIYKFLINQSQFENKSVWTILHIVPFLIAIWFLITNLIFQS